MGYDWQKVVRKYETPNLARFAEQSETISCTILKAAGL
jgi:hypothetical protein